MLLRARCEFLQCCYMDKCLSHWALFLSLTPTLRLLNQPLSHSSGPIQYDSPLYGQCGLRFSTLRRLCALCLQTLYVPGRIQKPLAHPAPLHKPNDLIPIIPLLLSVSLSRGTLLYQIILSRMSKPAGAI